MYRVGLFSLVDVPEDISDDVFGYILSRCLRGRRGRKVWNAIVGGCIYSKSGTETKGTEHAGSPLLTIEF